jgi:hypothetical protein
MPLMNFFFSEKSSAIDAKAPEARRIKTEKRE